MPAGERRWPVIAMGASGRSSGGGTAGLGSATTFSDLVCLLTVLVAVVGASFPDSDSPNGGGDLPSTTTSPDRSPGSVTPCPRCLTVADQREAAKLKREAIKRQILSKLNLRAKPNITSPLPPKDAVLVLLNNSALGSGRVDHSSLFASSSYLHSAEHHVGRQQSHHARNNNNHFGYAADDTFGEEGDDYYAKTAEIVAFAEPGAILNGHTLIDLHLPHDNPHRFEVKDATLWVHLRHDRGSHINSKEAPPPPPSTPTPTLYVFRVTTKSAETNGTSYVGKLVLNGSSTTGWKSINVRDEVRRWYAEKPSSKLTLLIDCSGGCPSFSLFGSHHYHDPWSGHSHADQPRNKHRHKKRSHSADFRPFLVIMTKPIERKRSRRHTITCNENTTGCCKQSLFVNFKELHWDDWIIAPKGYWANYCMGDCASGPRTPDTLGHFHSHVIEEYRNRNPYASIVPCCAPTRLSSMSLIYYDKNLNIIKTDLPQMIVEECGCT